MTARTATTQIAPGVYAAFTARHDGGVSQPPYDSLNLGLGVGDDPDAVRRNRAVAADRIGLAAARVAWMTQVHGAEVTVVTAPGAAGACDAMVTTRPGVALAVLVADCLPVLVADPEAGVVGAAHSGRPGTVQGVAGQLLAEMSRQGADPSRCVALLGPAICGACYEVPEHVRAEAAAAVPEAACRTRWGSPGVDIRAAVTAQLHSAGVREVRHDTRCTRETPDLYSYRRESTTGRFAGYIWTSHD